MKAFIDYKEITISDLVNLVKNHPEKYPHGLNTRIACGDYEGNTFHTNMSVEHYDDNPSYIVSLEFELHD
jgi:hypothetical protein